MRLYRLKILTPESRIYDGEVVGTTVTGEDGQLTVLAGHAPMAAALAEGAVTVQTGQETRKGVAGQGLLQVDHDGAVVLVRSFAWSGDELPEEGAKEAAVNDIPL